MSGVRVRFAWGYLALLAVVWVALWRFGDAASLPTVVAFGPRWAWGVPLLVLLFPPRRDTLLPLAAGTLIVLGPIMGFVSAGAWAGSIDVPGPPARIMTANLGSRQLTAGLLVALVGRLRPDIVLMQECTERAEPAFPRELWTFREDDGLCVASRHPVDAVEVRYRQDEPGHGAFAARYRIRFHDVAVTVANLHLDSPRDGFRTLLRDGGGLSGVQAAIDQRRAQSRAVRTWLDDNAGQPTLIVGGDFNTVPDGAIYRENWGHLVNAYSAGGIGWGYTKHEGWAIGARIDHILVGQRWRVQSAWVEASDGSDHLPLVADLVLTR
jgi:endonuclease/exonuclease/phosphatase (EEP) superfamily protein YafD